MSPRPARTGRRWAPPPRRAPAPEPGTRRCLGLALKPRDERRVLRQVLGEQLDGHRALQSHVEGQVDGGHAAEPKPPFHAVAPSDLRLAHFPPSPAPGDSPPPSASPPAG